MKFEAIELHFPSKIHKAGFFLLKNSIFSSFFVDVDVDVCNCIGNFSLGVHPILMAVEAVKLWIG